MEAKKHEKKARRIANPPELGFLIGRGTAIRVASEILFRVQKYKLFQ